MMNGKAYKRVLLLLIPVLLVIVSQVQSVLNRQRLEMGLTRTLDLGEDAPPVLAFTTVALGGFRGLIANALWIRANDLQQEGKYFEMVQLADWITKLEPHFTQVWLVQAWNMAYNISVKFSDHSDRWRWVQSGIRLLRDDGLRFNPREALIYRELAWFFQHKMGQNLDNAHIFYKLAWSTNMTEVFGGPRPDFQALIDPQTNGERARAEMLVEEYKMDPAIMKEVEEKYGPLEWRLPEAHAIYWSWVGLKRCKDEDRMALRRVVYQSMQQAVLHGRLIEFSTNFPPAFSANLNIVGKANQAYLDMIRDETEQKEGIGEAHKNFLRQAVYLLYSNNRLQEAQRYFDLVHELYPGAIPPGVPMRQWALDYLGLSIGSLTHDQTRTMIQSWLKESYLNLALGEEDQALGFLLKARDLRDHYMNRIEGQEERLGLPELEVLKADVLRELLAPESRLPAEFIERLREAAGVE